MIYLKELKERYSKSLVFSLRDINILFKNKKLSKQYSYLLISNLLKKGELKRITKGKYTFKDDIMVSGFAFSPFYYGLQDALSFHNLWEQETNPVIITSKNIKPGLRKIFDSNVYLRRINKKYLFGYDFIKYYDFQIPVSNIEKTLIDFVYYNEYISSEVIKEMKKKLNKKKLKEYLKIYNYSIKEKVLKLI
jgi:predicted transcriptional regulator of viral defense system